MMYDARIIANEILRRAWDEGLELTQIDVQKLSYFLHGHHLKDHGQPLISTEFEAWDYGPVQRDTYQAFKKFGDQPIEELAQKFDPIKRQYSDMPRLTDNSAIATIENYLDQYFGIPGFAMVEMTHKPGTPWSQTMEQAKTHVNVGMRIKNALIISRFEGLAPA